MTSPARRATAPARRARAASTSAVATAGSSKRPTAAARPGGGLRAGRRAACLPPRRRTARRRGTRSWSRRRTVAAVPAGRRAGFRLGSASAEPERWEAVTPLGSGARAWKVTVAPLPAWPTRGPRRSRPWARWSAFASNGDTCEGYLARPGGRRTVPGVIVVQEWWGLVDHITRRRRPVRRGGLRRARARLLPRRLDRRARRGAAAADGPGDGPGRQGHPGRGAATSPAREDVEGERRRARRVLHGRVARAVERRPGRRGQGRGRLLPGAAVGADVADLGQLRQQVAR